MPSLTSNRLPCIQIESAPNPTAAVIWMHGLGASGDDFAGLYPELDLDGCPAIRFIFPHAPQIPVTINGGYVMPAWYNIFGTELGAGAIRQEDAAGIIKSQADIEVLIAFEVARGIQPEHIVIAGFSQGCAMALHTGLRHKARLAGIMALSGYLPLASTLASEASPENKSTPIFMAHGTQDPVVVLDRAEASNAKLNELGYNVEWHTYSMPHSVHPREVADISAFLKRVLS
jgi:phospholipase/carboxylesterase